MKSRPSHTQLLFSSASAITVVTPELLAPAWGGETRVFSDILSAWGGETRAFSDMLSVWGGAAKVCSVIVSAVHHCCSHFSSASRESFSMLGAGSAAPEWNCLGPG